MVFPDRKLSSDINRFHKIFSQVCVNVKCKIKRGCVSWQDEAVGKYVSVLVLQFIYPAGKYCNAAEKLENSNVKDILDTGGMKFSQHFPNECKSLFLLLRKFFFLQHLKIALPGDILDNSVTRGFLQH